MFLEKYIHKEMIQCMAQSQFESWLESFSSSVAYLIIQRCIYYKLLSVGRQSYFSKINQQSFMPAVQNVDGAQMNWL